MHPRVLVPFVVLPLGLVLLAVEPSSLSGGEPEARPDGRLAHAASDVALLARAAEVARIRAHFDSVLAELPRRDVSALATEQRARRSVLLGTLRAYRDAGAFPRNYDFPGEAVPYFVDRGTGVLCAVAHLMASTGRRDIVDRVAAANNNVWVSELAGDTAFTRWLDDHGLTVAEAARIQVPYFEEGPPPSGDRARAPSSAAAWALGGAAVASLWTARANTDGRSRLGSALGIIAGTTAMGMGAASLDGERNAPAIGAASLLAGATSAWLSTRGIMRHRQAVATKREAERATVAPLLPVDGKSGAGVSVTLRF